MRRVGYTAVSYTHLDVYKRQDQTCKRAVGEDVVVRLRQLDLTHSPSLALARDIFIFSYWETVAEAIDSILQQTFMDFELIIINDGSIDNSEEIILSRNCSSAGSSRSFG